MKKEWDALRAWDYQSTSDANEKRKRHQCRAIVVLGALGDCLRQK